jgi:hypothetical protein
MKDLVELSKAHVEKVEDDVLFTQYKTGSEITEADAREIDGAHITMSQGGDMFVIVDKRAKDSKVDKSAEEYFNRKAKMVPYTKAVAVITEHKAGFLGRFMKKFMYPYKEFKSEEEAKAWINTLRN